MVPSLPLLSCELSVSVNNERKKNKKTSRTLLQLVKNKSNKEAYKQEEL